MKKINNKDYGLRVFMQMQHDGNVILDHYIERIITTSDLRNVRNVWIDCINSTVFPNNLLELPDGEPEIRYEISAILALGKSFANKEMSFSYSGQFMVSEKFDYTDLSRKIGYSFIDSEDHKLDGIVSLMTEKIKSS